MLDMLELTIHGAPVTKKNWTTAVRTGVKCVVCGKRKGRILLLPQKLYTEWVKNAVMGVKPDVQLPLPDQPYNLTALVYRARRQGDLSGFVQAIGDYLEQHGVVSNDKWFTQWDGTRLLHDKHDPRVEVTITPVVEATP